jgi:hypothetical protein
MPPKNWQSRNSFWGLRSLSLYLELNRKNIFSLSSSKRNTDEETQHGLLHRCHPKDEGLLLKKQVEKTFLKQNKNTCWQFYVLKSIGCGSESKKLVLNSGSASKRK